MSLSTPASPTGLTMPMLPLIERSSSSASARSLGGTSDGSSLGFGMPTLSPAPAPAPRSGPMPGRLTINTGTFDAAPVAGLPLSLTGPLKPSHCNFEVLVRVSVGPDSDAFGEAAMRDFDEYCTASFCSEIPLFYRRVIRYQQWHPQLTLGDRIRIPYVIYSNFIVSNAPNEINLDHRCRQQIIDCLAPHAAHIDRLAELIEADAAPVPPPSDVFDSALKEIVLQLDCLVRTWALTRVGDVRMRTCLYRLRNRAESSSSSASSPSSPLAELCRRGAISGGSLAFRGRNGAAAAAAAVATAAALTTTASTAEAGAAGVEEQSAAQQAPLLAPSAEQADGGGTECQLRPAPRPAGVGRPTRRPLSQHAGLASLAAADGLNHHRSGYEATMLRTPVTPEPAAAEALLAGAGAPGGGRLCATPPPTPPNVPPGAGSGRRSASSGPGASTATGTHGGPHGPEGSGSAGGLPASAGALPPPSSSSSSSSSSSFMGTSGTGSHTADGGPTGSTSPMLAGVFSPSHHKRSASIQASSGSLLRPGSGGSSQLGSAASAEALITPSNSESFYPSPGHGGGYPLSPATSSASLLSLSGGSTQTISSISSVGSHSSSAESLGGLLLLPSPLPPSSSSLSSSSSSSSAAPTTTAGGAGAFSSSTPPPSLGPEAKAGRESDRRSGGVSALARSARSSVSSLFSLESSRRGRPRSSSSAASLSSMGIRPGGRSAVGAGSSATSLGGTPGPGMATHHGTLSSQSLGGVPCHGAPRSPAGSDALPYWALAGPGGGGGGYCVEGLGSTVSSLSIDTSFPSSPLATAIDYAEGLEDNGDGDADDDDDEDFSTPTGTQWRAPTPYPGDSPEDVALGAGPPRSPLTAGSGGPPFPALRRASGPVPSSPLSATCYYPPGGDKLSVGSMVLGGGATGAALAMATGKGVAAPGPGSSEDDDSGDDTTLMMRSLSDTDNPSDELSLIEALNSLF
ncbi:hypothetical protein H696_03456 [Fonticula alba]|uniref:RGS domain-containing protein n=1 Tax=Fonticula alba TaxID=691883 RepID=A0A058Z7D4_FONAL|nr:hypothetical protein H696_03456 [Fonticula alba]KCV69991.1 hypothetical protein H696_03456 [Fonticula alba]|eukprot:XP_009495597.1 hypothetical protein H696_03456 [Fonticula alba]